MGEFLERLYLAMHLAFNHMDVTWEIDLHPKVQHSPVPIVQVRVYGGNRQVYAYNFSPYDFAGGDAETHKRVVKRVVRSLKDRF